MSYNSLASIWICFTLFSFDDGDRFLFCGNFIHLCLSSSFLWTCYKCYWYLNSDSLFCTFFYLWVHSTGHISDNFKKIWQFNGNILCGTGKNSNLWCVITCLFTYNLHSPLQITFFCSITTIYNIIFGTRYIYCKIH